MTYVLINCHDSHYIDIPITKHNFPFGHRPTPQLQPLGGILAGFNVVSWFDVEDLGSWFGSSPSGTTQSSMQGPLTMLRGFFME